MTCSICGAWWSGVARVEHDCLTPECPVLCLMGFVWVKQADGKWYAETDYIERARVAQEEQSNG